MVSSAYRFAITAHPFIRVKDRSPKQNFKDLQKKKEIKVSDALFRMVWKHIYSIANMLYTNLGGLCTKEKKKD